MLKAEVGETIFTAQRYGWADADVEVEQWIVERITPKGQIVMAKVGDAENVVRVNANGIVIGAYRKQVISAEQAKYFHEKRHDAQQWKAISRLIYEMEKCARDRRSKTFELFDELSVLIKAKREKASDV